MILHYFGFNNARSYRVLRYYICISSLSFCCTLIGDTESVARQVSSQLGIAAECCHYRLLPQQKLQWIRAQQHMHESIIPLTVASAESNAQSSGAASATSLSPLHDIESPPPPPPPPPLPLTPAPPATSVAPPVQQVVMRSAAGGSCCQQTVAATQVQVQKQQQHHAYSPLHSADAKLASDSPTAAQTEVLFSIRDGEQRL